VPGVPQLKFRIAVRVSIRNPGSLSLPQTLCISRFELFQRLQMAPI
jgi:hypothetical protein